MHLLTRIEARRHIETTRLSPKSHAFSLSFLSVFTNYLHYLSTISIKLVIIAYLLHLLTRIKTKRHVKTTRLLSKSHVFSLLSLIAFTNYLHRLSTILIKLLIIVYLLHLLTRIETRRYVKMARLLSKSHVFSLSFSTIFANQSIASIRLVIIVYILHLLTRIETRRHVETTRLLPKSHIFSLLSLIVFTNHLHCLSTILIRLLIIVYLLHLLTRIETRKYVKMTRLLFKSYTFSLLFLTTFAN